MVEGVPVIDLELSGDGDTLGVRHVVALVEALRLGDTEVQDEGEAEVLRVGERVPHGEGELDGLSLREPEEETDAVPQRLTVGDALWKNDREPVAHPVG